MKTRIRTTSTKINQKNKNWKTSVKLQEGSQSKTSRKGQVVQCCGKCVKVCVGGGGGGGRVVVAWRTKRGGEGRGWRDKMG